MRVSRVVCCPTDQMGRVLPHSLSARTRPIIWPEPKSRSKSLSAPLGQTQESFCYSFAQGVTCTDTPPQDRRSSLHDFTELQLHSSRAWR